MDVVDKKTRSRMMSGIKGANTKPEIYIRKSLHRLGFRFRIHSINLPGKPDIVLPKYKTVLLIHGCFWHGHGCHIFKWPNTRKEFWKKKIEGNRYRDKKNISILHKLGWKVTVIWECEIKNDQKNNGYLISNLEKLLKY